MSLDKIILYIIDQFVLPTLKMYIFLYSVLMVENLSNLHRLMLKAKINVSVQSNNFV